MTGLRHVHALGELLEVTAELAVAYDRPTDCELAFLTIVRTLSAAKTVLRPEQFSEFLRRWEEGIDDPATLEELREMQAPDSWPALVPTLLDSFGPGRSATTG